MVRYRYAFQSFRCWKFRSDLAAAPGLASWLSEEIAFKNGWIGVDQLLAAGSGLTRTAYGKYLIRLAESAMN